MDIIIDKKVQLIGWLAGEEMILQHVNSQKLITMYEYMKIKNVQNPSTKMTELLDVILSKGDSCCMDFLKLLREDKVNESRPELRDWITTLNIPEKKENNDTSQASRIKDNEAFLRKNRGELIDKVKTVDRIVCDLEMNREMEANVHAETTEQAKMRKVLDYTNSKKAAQRLVDALFKHANDVMEDLLMA